MIETPAKSDKCTRYAALVSARKEYDPSHFSLTNPSRVENGKYDSDEIGPWTRWAHDLAADLMVFGQDWGDVDYFIATRGFDAPNNPTNKALRSLLSGVNRPIPPVPSEDESNDPARATCGVFLTNALLWLKRGGMSSPVKEEWFLESAAPFILEQIDIVKPRVVVALGSQAYRGICAAYRLNHTNGAFNRMVEDQSGLVLPRTANTRLFGVYHCGARVQNITKSLENQHLDWRKISVALRAQRE